MLKETPDPVPVYRHSVPARAGTDVVLQRLGSADFATDSVECSSCYWRCDASTMQQSVHAKRPPTVLGYPAEGEIIRVLGIIEKAKSLKALEDLLKQILFDALGELTTKLGFAVRAAGEECHCPPHQALATFVMVHGVRPESSCSIASIEESCAL
jgi:hypothetical protein